jgi:hypothetical protein
MQNGEGRGRQSSRSTARRIADASAIIWRSKATSMRSFGFNVSTAGSARYTSLISCGITPNARQQTSA